MDLALSCQFCGQPTVGWQECFHLDDDHDNNDADNVASSCSLCHLPQHLNRPEIDAEATIIWLPEMSQAALNLLARQVHIAFAKNGYTMQQLLNDQVLLVALRPTQEAYKALHRRSKAAADQLGTASPKALGKALLDLDPSDYARRADLLRGLRLLPLGRLYRDGHDVYPDMLRSWVEADDAIRAGTSRSAAAAA